MTARPARRKPAAAPAPVFEIRVTLLHIKPPVRRRLLVPGGMTLRGLHAVLQIAMGWTDSHLHLFRIGPKEYSDPAFELGEFDEDREVRDEHAVTLSGAIGKGRRKSFFYDYDFGDGWEHLVEVLEVHPPGEAPGKAPVCLEGTGACPPEDVGGAGGYEDFLEAMADPDHPEHESFLEWVGGEFDAAAFDPGEVNGELRRLRP